MELKEIGEWCLRQNNKGVSQIGDGRKSRNEIRDGRRREIKIALEFEDEEEGL